MFKFIPNTFKRDQDFREDIIRSNSGMSSKSYVMLEGMKLAKIIVYWYLGVLTLEIFTPFTLRTNWIEFVAVLGGLSAFVLASAWGKVKGEQSYWSSQSYGSNIRGEEINNEEGVG